MVSVYCNYIINKSNKCEKLHCEDMDTSNYLNMEAEIKYSFSFVIVIDYFSKHCELRMLLDTTRQS